MIEKDELFETGDQERIWQKYCGFLDLSLQEFMEIQEQLLMEQIELVYDSPLAKKFMPKKPKDMTEFRQLVPLTTYEDYADYLNQKNEDVLAIKPLFWTRSSGRGGSLKWIPYTERSAECAALYSITLMILACAPRKGEVAIKKGVRVLHNLPPRPYITGVMGELMPQVMDMRFIPPPDKYENVDFQTRTQAGFNIALRTGVDFLASLTPVLIKMGEHFAESSGQMRLNRQMLHPAIILRLVRAWMSAKREGRPVLPKDLWSLKGLSCYGTDTTIHKEELKYYWGKTPLETYASTETTIISTQAWNKRYMTFVPASCFAEFIPESEWLKSRDKKEYQPTTVLLNEVEVGQRYEIVVTCFYGMPFLRYRLGDIIRIVALEDEEAGIRLPQMMFESRVADLIDIAGFAQFDEKTIWKAIANTEIMYEDWSARKEYEKSTPILRLYIELKQDADVADIERLVQEQLININPDYRDLDSMLGMRSLRVTLIPRGSFQRYYQAKQAAGADLAHLKPPHMGASDSIIRQLLS
jgi:hypothetical protein